jgi:hypothetical protein
MYWDVLNFHPLENATISFKNCVKSAKGCRGAGLILNLWLAKISWKGFTSFYFTPNQITIFSPIWVNASSTCLSLRVYHVYVYLHIFANMHITSLISPKQKQKQKKHLKKNPTKLRLYSNVFCNTSFLRITKEIYSV